MTDSTSRMFRGLIAFGFFLGLAAQSLPAQAAPCMIFVHGKQTNTNTYTNWNAARDYWKSGSRDFVKTVTKNFSTPYYVVGYKGTDPYWGSGAAAEVTNEIINATNGGADGGGNRCTGATSYWVIAHSMGGTVMDFILGNNDSSDPNYNMNASYSTVASRISLVITVAGAHRGSEGADAVCGNSNFLCNFIGGFIQDCDSATYWLRSADDVQVRTYSNSPARNIYLTGGYKGIFGASACLSGEDDGVVQHASAYACNGGATTSYNNSNVCNNSNKQESSGFRNIDVGYENHDNERNDKSRSTRRAIPGGIWTCSGSPCSPGSKIQSRMSAAQMIAVLY